MKDFDEYQRMMRYRNGHHSFFLTLALILLNVLIEMMRGIGWGVSNSVETLVIFSVSIIFFNVMNTLQGAYFRKAEKPLWGNLGILTAGVIYCLIYFDSNPNPAQELLLDGKVTIRAVQFLVILNAFSIPLTYFIKYFIDRKNEDF